MAAEPEEYESVLCVKPAVLVYRVPPRASNRGYRWGPRPPAGCQRLLAWGGSPPPCGVGGGSPPHKVCGVCGSQEVLGVSPSPRGSKNCLSWGISAPLRNLSPSWAL